jgi:predicted DNA binding CopG/RHH family protein
VRSVQLQVPVESAEQAEPVEQEQQQDLQDLNPRRTLSKILHYHHSEFNICHNAFSASQIILNSRQAS